MTGYDFIGCARRFGQVFIGRVEPSVKEVVETATEIQNLVGSSVEAALSAVYNQAIEEEVPADLLHTLESLGSRVTPASYVPPKMRQRVAS